MPIHLASRRKKSSTIQKEYGEDCVIIDVTSKEYLGNAWVVWRGEMTYDVEILFQPEAALVVTETNWHHTQKVVWHDNGSATLRFKVDGLNEIVWWLLGWAPFASVETPVELREMLVENLNKAISKNKTD